MLSDKQFYILIGLGLLGLWYAKNKVAEVAGDVGHAVNPLNYDNVFSGAGNSLGTALTGDDDFSLGVKIHDWLHGENAGLY